VEGTVTKCREGGEEPIAEKGGGGSPLSGRDGSQLQRKGGGGHWLLSLLPIFRAVPNAMRVGVEGLESVLNWGDRLLTRATSPDPPTPRPSRTHTHARAGVRTGL
jgi:hypothetical protein